MQFDYFSPTKIIFGAGRLNDISSIVSEYSDNILVITGGQKVISNRLLTLLEQGKIKSRVIKIEHEPTIESVSDLVRSSMQTSFGLIIGIGGGSVIDSAKAISALTTNSGDVTDYLEVIGRGKTLSKPSIPVIAIPTTAGTGSEVTKNAVLGSQQHGMKVSLRSSFLYPKIAVVDPELTISLPPVMTAYTGLDALTQLIEPYTCNIPNPLIDALCIEGMSRISRSLYEAYDNGNDIKSREDMSIGSLFSGIALANAKLGAVHGLAGPIGGLISANHSAICAALLPHVISINLMAMNAREPSNPAIERFNRVGQILAGDENADASRAIRWIIDFCRHAKIPKLSELGLSEAYFDDIIEKAQKSSSMKGNSITLTASELRNILQMPM